MICRDFDLSRFRCQSCISHSNDFRDFVPKPNFGTIASKINEIEKILEQYHNNFCEISSKFTPINTSIKILQNDMTQCYAVIQRPEFDQSVSNGSETNSRGSSTNSSSSSPGSSGSSGSSQRFANIISVIREQFSDIFDRIKGANDYSLDQMCAVISVDILKLGMGVIGKVTIKAFYREDNIKSENLKDKMLG
ncbi:hypothetical protein C1646_750637 [Rhizophagus diaphanus]|nr:hypothetical protein C1646_750637 [Rhizophagus diaphanus] [Rhizophagus sp. MUCL 43196]